MLSKAKLLKHVRESIKRWNPPEGDFEMLVLEKDVKMRDGRWWVPIYPSRPPKREYHLIDSLGGLETELQLDKNLDIEIYPAFVNIDFDEVPPIVVNRARKSEKKATA